MPRHTALVAAALGGVLAGAACGAAPARAASAPRVGSITTSIAGVPAQVTVGGSFSPTFTIRSASAYRIEVEDFYFSLENPAASDATESTGIEVRWKDPATGGWRLSSEVRSSGVWALSEPAGTVWIAPRGSLSIRLYITLNGAAARGIDVLSTTGICAYSLYDTSGANVPGMLGYNHANAQFVFGAASNGPASAFTTAGGTPTAGVTAASTTPWSAPSQSSSTPAASGGAAGSSGPGESTALAAISAPGSSTGDRAAAPTARFATYSAALAALVLVGFAAFAGGVVLTRRGRGRR